MSKVGLGYISTNTFERPDNSFLLPLDESVCGMLFDLSGFKKPFDDYYAIRQYFGDGQTQLIHNMEEASDMGLWNNQFMNGLAYYHIKSFYDYVGKDAPLYVCFADCSGYFEKNEDVLEKMQMAAGGKIFQIGIWTAQKLWINTDSGLIFTPLCTNIEIATEILTGKVGAQTSNYSPVSTLICPNTSFSGSRTLLEVPNGLTLNLPKISVCIAQNGSELNHIMQNKNPDKAPVGCLGFLMGAICLAYAEESIGYVAKFNLNKLDTFSNAEVWFGESSISLNQLQYGKIYAADRGYILPTTYAGKEAEVFFTGDPTFSKGDYYCLANNRVMHKVRRAILSALIPYLHGNYELDVINGTLSVTTQSVLTSAVLTMLDNVMFNKEHQNQLSSRQVSFVSSFNILEKDEITMATAIQPVNYSNVINEKDTIK